MIDIHSIYIRPKTAATRSSRKSKYDFVVWWVERLQEVNDNENAATVPNITKKESDRIRAAVYSDTKCMSNMRNSLFEKGFRISIKNIPLGNPDKVTVEISLEKISRRR